MKAFVRMNWNREKGITEFPGVFFFSNESSVLMRPLTSESETIHDFKCVCIDQSIFSIYAYKDITDGLKKVSTRNQVSVWPIELENPPSFVQQVNCPPFFFLCFPSLSYIYIYLFNSKIYTYLFTTFCVCLSKRLNFEHEIKNWTFSTHTKKKGGGMFRAPITIILSQTRDTNKESIKSLTFFSFSLGCVARVLTPDDLLKAPQMVRVLWRLNPLSLIHSPPCFLCFYLKKETRTW